MSRRNLIILDFDRTLLDPSELSRHFLRLLLTRGLLSEAAEAAIQTDLGDPNHSLDLANELTAHGVDLTSALKLAHEAFRPNQFLYPDVTPFLERFKDQYIVIMTSGGRDWQTAKLTLCTALEPYLRIILAGNKGEHILAELTGQPESIGLAGLGGEQFAKLVLVDDRLDNLVPLAGQPLVELWHLQRPGAKYNRTAASPGIRTVTTLKEIH
jgi:hypothetical protein